MVQDTQRSLFHSTRPVSRFFVRACAGQLFTQLGSPHCMQTTGPKNSSPKPLIILIREWATSLEFALTLAQAISQSPHPLHFSGWTTKVLYAVGNVVSPYRTGLTIFRCSQCQAPTPWPQARTENVLRSNLNNTAPVIPHQSAAHI